MTVNETIKTLREAKGLSRTELAKRCGVTRAAVQQWEREDGTAPRREHQDKVAEVLGVTVAELMGYPSTPTAPALVPAEGLSAVAYRVGQMFDQLTDLKDQEWFYSFLVSRGGWTTEPTAVATEEAAPPPAPRKSRAQKR